MKYLKFFALFILLFLSNRVYALETTSVYRNSSMSTAGFLYTDSSSITGTIKNGSLNTVYANASYGITFFINKGQAIGKVYKIRVNFNDYDYLKSNNHNKVIITNGEQCSVIGFQLLNQGGSNNQAKGVDITYTCLSAGAYTGVQLAYYNEDNSAYDRITTINWRINNVQWEQVDDNQAAEIIANASINTQNIINNSNENTQDIIDNQNQNTQDIIDNQNQNTQDMIDSQKVCNNIDINKNDIEIDGKFLNSSGSEVQSQNYGITKYVNIENTKLYVLLEDTILTNAYMCFYNSNKVQISCSTQDNLTINQEIVPPTNTVYVRFTISKLRDRPQFTMKSCKDGNQALSDDINDLNDTIKDDNIGSATSDAGDFITGFDTNTFGLTSIITAPLNLIQSITSSTCTDLQIPLPYLNNKKLILPCMTPIYQSTFGSLFTLYQTITFGIIAYWICVRIFNMVKDFKNPDHDEIEVVDL